MGDIELNKKFGYIVGSIVDIIFFIVYVLLFVVSIIDLIGYNIPFIETYTNDSNQLSKFLLLIFASVGIITINDKRTIEKKVVDPINGINEVISHGLISGTNLFYFKNKKDDYNFFAREIRNLHSGSEVLVTSFDKNQNTNYYTGEDKHTEALMDDYTRMIQSGNIRVRQMVHVCTKKEYDEVIERVKLYENYNNYSLSAMAGLPIRPYIDFVIINKEIVMLSFSNDKSAPYNEAFSIAIKDKEIAAQFEKYFDIYWNNDCCVIKGNDGIIESNLEYLKALALDSIVDTPEYTEYKALLLKLILSVKEYSNLKKIINVIHQLTYQKLYFQRKEIAKSEIKTFYSSIYKKLMKDSIDLTWSDMSAVLTQCYEHVSKSFFSVTVINEDSYWDDEIRIESFVNNLITLTNIKREHVYVLSANALTQYKKIIKKEIKSGVQVYVVIDDNIQDNGYKNFMVLDEILVISLSCFERAYSIIDKEKIREYLSDFSTIKVKANTNI